MDNLNNEILVVKGQINELITLKNYVDSRCNLLEDRLQKLLADRTAIKVQNNSLSVDRDFSPSPRHASP
jgi:hypothetical protein